MYREKERCTQLCREQAELLTAALQTTTTKISRKRQRANKKAKQPLGVDVYEGALRVEVLLWRLRMNGVQLAL